MLMLTLKAGERVFINHGEIVLTFLEGDKGRVLVGFDAAREIPINREKVELALQRDKQPGSR